MGNTLFELAENVNPEAFEYLKANFQKEKVRPACYFPK